MGKFIPVRLLTYSSVCLFGCHITSSSSLLPLCLYLLSAAHPFIPRLSVCRSAAHLSSLRQRAQGYHSLGGGTGAHESIRRTTEGGIWPRMRCGPRRCTEARAVRRRR
ncbi:hypothetical protein HOY80DRAFT_512084 [Tuber brumale]|nr:hypothetical protein HOY80DRAFT_512084 [Tuber brumale]